MIVNDAGWAELERVEREGWTWVEIGYGAQFVEGRGWIPFLVEETGYDEDLGYMRRRPVVLDERGLEEGPARRLAHEAAHEEAARHIGDWAIFLQHYDRCTDIVRIWEGARA